MRTGPYPSFISRECPYDRFKLESRLTRVYRRHGRSSCGPSNENAYGLGTAPQLSIFEMKLSVSISFFGLVVTFGCELSRIWDLEDVLSSGFSSLSYLLDFDGSKTFGILGKMCLGCSCSLQWLANEFRHKAGRANEYLMQFN